MTLAITLTVCFVFLCIVCVCDSLPDRTGKDAPLSFEVSGHRKRRNTGSVPSIYQQIAQISGGSVFNTDKTNVSNVASVIVSAHPYVLLSSFSMFPGGTPYRAINVDNTISHVKISIMERTKAQRPIVTVSDPNGTPVLLSTTYLGNGALEIILTATEFGTWWLRKQDSYSWDVSVYGDTIVDFTDTFLGTLGTTGLALQMEGKPIIGKNTPVIIQVSGAEKVASVTGVTILDTNGTEISRYPLLPQGHRGDTFKTQLTIPTVPFRVTVEGKDTQGNTLVRADKSVVKASALQLKIQDLKGDLQVNGHLYLYITVTNQGDRFSQVAITISDDEGLVVPPKDRMVYLFPGISATVYFEIAGGSTSGVSSNVMIKASPSGADSDDFQYVMRTFTVHAASK